MAFFQINFNFSSILSVWISKIHKAVALWSFDDFDDFNHFDIEDK